MSSRWERRRGNDGGGSPPRRGSCATSYDAYAYAEGARAMRGEQLTGAWCHVSQREVMGGGQGRYEGRAHRHVMMMDEDMDELFGRGLGEAGGQGGGDDGGEAMEVEHRR